VHTYSRFTPLCLESEGLERGYLDVQPGDCVVAFSRRDIYDIKQLIEAGTGQRYAPLSGTRHATLVGGSAIHFAVA
jgi:ATP-dependent RNA helicase SUPV3L1/SUV3